MWLRQEAWRLVTGQGLGDWCSRLAPSADCQQWQHPFVVRSSPAHISPSPLTPSPCRAEGDAAAARQRALQSDAVARARERDLDRAAKAAEACRAAEHEAGARAAAAEEAAQKLEGELAAGRRAAAGLEAQLKARDKELKELGKQVRRVGWRLVGAADQRCPEQLAVRMTCCVHAGLEGASK